MNVEFGSIDVKTGISSSGYMENGQMKFKKTPWYKRLFSTEPIETEFLGICKRVNKNNTIEIELCVYRKFNPYTNETKEIYAENELYGKFSFDINAFEQMGRLIMI